MFYCELTILLSSTGSLRIQVFLSIILFGILYYVYLKRISHLSIDLELTRPIFPLKADPPRHDALPEKRMIAFQPSNDVRAANLGNK